ncbi:MAG: efflux RND transporter periplasmic adaptor subunit [Thiobacillaceae bacterium]|nr:efflux RND transporter periplasmic adaptor subunit [Thiobacillaceae bacterium]MCX7672318.1 efflux RND transporter periplasmic adaptor subunit [Thiobacillaceae bacterium]MDW8323257.1 efflux RND transporter periplasmic adaptor subunit [Burkholderiales bacterium]
MPAPLLTTDRNPPLRARLFLLVMLIALAAGCGGEGKPQGGVPGGQPAAGPAGAAMPPPEVEVVRVARGTATLTPELPGRVEAVRTAQVRARVEGIVERRLFTEGAQVRRGQPLFRLDDRPYRAAVQSAEAEVELRRIQLQRLEQLLPHKAVSEQEVDLARAQLKQAEAQLTRARLDLEYTQVPAPISGRIGRALVSEGALARPGEATPLAVIEQLDPVYVLFTQPAAEALRLRASSGRTADIELILEDGSRYAHKGRLITRDARVDPTTGAVTFKAEFPNPEQWLLPGAFVRVRPPQGQLADVVRVPQRAVLSGAQGQYVLVVDGERKVSARPVRLGPMAGTDFVVLEGLEGGETVIVSGVQKAKPGSVVNPRPPDRPGAPR